MNRPNSSKSCLILGLAIIFCFLVGNTLSAYPQGFSYNIPAGINNYRKQNRLQALKGVYEIDSPIVSAECQQGNQTSCKLLNIIYDGCVEYCNNLYPDPISSSNMACVFQGCSGLAAPPSSSPRSGNQNYDNNDRGRTNDCYSNCDERERNCNKVNRFTGKYGGSDECAAERRACDARCR